MALYFKCITDNDKPDFYLDSTMSTPAHSPSPRKHDMNGHYHHINNNHRRINNSITITNGASSVGTSEDGEESSSVPDDEDDCNMIKDQLSAIQSPSVSFGFFIDEQSFS